MMTTKAFLQTVAGGAAAITAISTSPLSSAAPQANLQANPKVKKSGKLLAGVAKKKITPSLADLNEYKKIDSHFGGEVGQDIYARIIVLGNESGNKLLLLSTDLLNVPRYNELAANISKKYGIDKNACIMSGTQNHQAVVLGSQKPIVAKIEKDMMDIILAGIGEAIAAMQPAKMALAKGASNINVHFGMQTPLGVVSMPDFSKFADKELSVLRIDDLSGKTMALYVNYGMQSNMMYDCSNKLSGDIAGNISAYIERRLGCMCAWAVGAAAEAYPLTTASLNSPVFDVNGKAGLEKQTLSENGTSMLRNYLTSVQGLDIININSKITRFSDTFSVRCGEQEYAAAGKKGRLTHRLHLAVVNEDIAFAGANSITSAGLGKIVKGALPYRTVFLSSEGEVVGYVVDTETDPNGVAGLHCVAADAWESEKSYVEGFKKLAKTIQ